MSSPSKRKGTSFERAVADYLAANGFPGADRRVLTGNRDKGDIAGVPDTVIEVKNEKAIRLGEYMTELAEEAHNARATYAAVVVKRRGHMVSQSYAVMPLHDFAAILRELLLKDDHQS